MALALSDGFEALCSFAPLPQILAACAAQPELADLVGSENVAALQAAAAAAGSKGQQLDAKEVGRAGWRCAQTCVMSGGLPYTLPCHVG